MNPDYAFVACLYVVLALAAWSLRPWQSRPVSARWSVVGPQVTLVRILFNASGKPRKYAWCAPLVVALLLVPVMWWWLSDA